MRNLNRPQILKKNDSIKKIVRKVTEARNDKEKNLKCDKKVIWKAFDPENPLNLDYHGFDHQLTLMNDRREKEIKKEFHKQKCGLQKRQLERQYLDHDNFHEIKSEKSFSEETEDELNKTVATKLLRTENKPINVEKIDKILQKKKNQIQDRLDRKLLKKEHQLMQIKKEKKDNTSLVIAFREFKDDLKAAADVNLDLLTTSSSLKNNESQKKIESNEKGRKTYVCTTKGVETWKEMVATRNKEIKQRNELKEEFYKQLGKKIILSQRREENVGSMNRTVEVNQKPPGTYNLRSYIYKSSSEPQGKIIHRQKSKTNIRTDQSSLKKSTKAPRKFLGKPTSSKEMAEPSVELKFKMPEKTKIKKFNLFKYLFQNERGSDENGNVWVPKDETEQHPRRWHAFTETQSAINDDKDDRGRYARPILIELPTDQILPPNVGEMEKTGCAKTFKLRHHHHHLDYNQKKDVVVNYLMKIPKSVKPCDKAAKMEKYEKVDRETGDKIIEFKSLSRSLRKLNEVVTKNENYAGNLVQETQLNQKELREHFQKEIASIDSCLSSDSSSAQTDFSSDSGSFIVLYDKKVPMDFITKSVIPFNEHERSRIVAKPYEKLEQLTNAYRVQSNSDHEKEKSFKGERMSESSSKLREKLNEKMKTLEREFLGFWQRKNYPSLMAKDLNEDYFDVMKEQAFAKPYKPRQEMEQLRNLMRKKFEICYYRDSQMEQKLLQRKFDQDCEENEKFIKTCENFFNHQQDKSLTKLNKKIHSIPSFYEETHNLQGHYFKLLKKFDKSAMEIQHIDYDFSRIIAYKNFLYSMMNETWKKALNKDQQLTGEQVIVADENPEGMPSYMTTENGIFLRGVYENYSSQLKDLNRYTDVLTDPEVLKYNIANLIQSAFNYLRECDMYNKLHIELMKAYSSFEAKTEMVIAEQRNKIKKSREKIVVMENYVKMMESKTKQWLEKPLKSTVANPHLRTIIALCNSLFAELIPESTTKDNVKDESDYINKFSSVFDYTIDLLAQYDKLPQEIVLIAQATVRKRRALKQRQSKRAFDLDRRLKLMAVDMARSEEPPYKKPPKTEPLPRLFLVKKKKIIPKKEEKITRNMMKFLAAFTDGAVMDVQKIDKDLVTLLNKITDDCIPFYFDHFLRLHDYEPQTDFVTKVEQEYGNEENRFRFSDCLPTVHAKMEQWKLRKQQEKERNIKKTWYLYQ